MRITKAIVGALFLLSESSASLADAVSSAQPGVGNLLAEAMACSKSALETYAAGTCEAANVVVEAAIQKCDDRWDRAAMGGNDFEHYQVDNDVIEAYHNAVKFGIERSSGNIALDMFNLKMRAIRTTKDVFTNAFRYSALTSVLDVRVSAKKSCP